MSRVSEAWQASKAIMNRTDPGHLLISFRWPNLIWSVAWKDLERRDSIWRESLRYLLVQNGQRIQDFLPQADFCSYGTFVVLVYCCWRNIHNLVCQEMPGPQELGHCIIYSHKFGFTGPLCIQFPLTWWWVSYMPLCDDSCQGLLRMSYPPKILVVIRLNDKYHLCCSPEVFYYPFKFLVVILI